MSHSHDHHGHDHGHAHGHGHEHHHDHGHHHHPDGQPHQAQPLGASLLRLSATSRLGAAVVAIAAIWVGVWLAMR